MSDARLPPEGIDCEADPPRPKGLRLSEAGIIATARLDVLGDGSLKEALAAASPAANGAAPREQTSTSRPEIEDADFDDVQPMLDLRFPEAEQPFVGLPDGAQDTEAEPPVSALLDTAHDASAAATPNQSDDDADRPSLPPAEIVVEVSPIFSALDAADRASAQAQQHRHAFAEPRPGILLPAQPQFNGAQRFEPPPPVEPEHQPFEEIADIPQPPPLEAEAEAAPPDEPAALEGDEAHGTAAAQIAVEANATAEALENLKLLLSHNMPLTETPPPPAPVAPATEPAAFSRESIAAPAFAPPPAFTPTYAANAEEDPEPVTPPPMIPLSPITTMTELRHMDPPPRRTGRAVASFLAGFALSWVFGAVLYVYLTMA
jgi:hypothetical protein